MKDNNSKIIISLFLNIIIVIFTILAMIILFSGFKFMFGEATTVESTIIGRFRFFTIDSNLFMGIVALIFAIEEIKVLRNKKKEISIRLYILKLMATVSVALTFFVVFVYLGPISKGGIPSMLMNSDLFFHCLIPILSIICFVSFEKTNNIRFKHTFLGLVPMGLYGTYYVSNILLHMENGKVSPVYDWYWFVQYGVWTAAIVVPIMFIITYLISLSLWRLNKEK